MREQGLTVLGLGTAKSPEVWRAACTEFELLPVPPPAEKPARKPGPPLGDRDRQLRMAIANRAAGLPMAQIGAALAKSGTKPPDGSNWRAYMRTRPDLYDLDAKGPGASVRWRGP